MSEPFLSEIRIMGFNFAPRGWATCDGQILPINQNQSLYSLLGTTYGGDGRTSFALPDMRGRVPIHEGDSGSVSLLDADGSRLGVVGTMLAAAPFLTSKDQVSRRSALNYGSIAAAALYLAACENPFDLLEEAKAKKDGKVKGGVHALSSVSLGQRGGTEGEVLTTSQMPSHSHAMNASNALATSDEPTGNFPAVAADNVYGALGGGAGTKGVMPVVQDAGAGQAHNNMQPYLVLNFCIALQGLFPSRN